MEVRSPSRETAKNRTLELSDVRAFAGDHGTAGIGGSEDLSRCFALQDEQWKIARPLRRIGEPEVEWSYDGVVPYVRAVVAGCVCAGNICFSQGVIQAGDTF